MALTVFDRFLLNTVLYLISWAVKIAGDIILKISTQKKTIKIWQCNFVNYSQKIHLMLFNMAVLDILVFCTRTIFHSRDLGLLENGLAIVTLVFSAYDFTEIWILGSSYLHPKAYTSMLIQTSQSNQANQVFVIDKVGGDILG